MASVVRTLSTWGSGGGGAGGSGGGVAGDAAGGVLGGSDLVSPLIFIGNLKCLANPYDPTCGGGA